MGLGVIAKLPIKEGAEAEFESAFLDLRAKVLANESGCTFYNFYKSRDVKGQYVVMEHYASKEAFEAHSKSAHFRDAQPALGKCIGGAPELTILDQVD